MVRCLVVDDESPAIDLLKQHISLIKELDLAAYCYSAVEAFSILQKESIDLLFLDLEMPVLKGLDFLKSLHKAPKVIITTAYRDYAVESYDLDVVDYLLKPISFERFVKSIDRYHDRCATLVSKESCSQKSNYFYVNINKRYTKIKYDEILYIESLKDYVRIHMKDQRLIAKMNIGKIESQLPSDRFLRVHRSFIISLDKISAYTQKDIQIADFEIPIGSSYQSKISPWIHAY